ASGARICQTWRGGAGARFARLVGAGVWLFLQDFLQATLKLGAAWKLVLGVVFVLLVCFLRQGIIGGVKALFLRATTRSDAAGEARNGGAAPQLTAEEQQRAAHKR